MTDFDIALLFVIRNYIQCFIVFACWLASVSKGLWPILNSGSYGGGVTVIPVIVLVGQRFQEEEECGFLLFLPASTTGRIWIPLRFCCVEGSTLTPCSASQR